jgi:hypothetical protein
MKKQILTSLIVIIITLFAATYTARASVVTNVSTDISLLVFVPCANAGGGEFVDLEGPLHTLFTVTLDRRGGAHVKMLNQPQGISGVGLTTGDKYQATGVTQEQFTTKVGLTDTFINNFRIIGQGTGNNYLVHETAHITVNANGTVTVFFDNLTIDCK